MRKQNEKKSAKEIIDHDIFERRININWIGQGDVVTGYLCNLKPYKVADEQNNEISCLLLYFVDEKGDYYKSLYYYEPYFYVIVKSEIVL